MLRDVVSVEPIGGHRLHVTFEDGVEGVIDVGQLVQFTGVFESLSDPAFFAAVRVHPELGTVCWPNDADLDSEVLYSKVAGIALPDYVPTPK